MASKVRIQAISASFLVIAFFLSESHNVAEGFKVNLQLYFNYSHQGDHLYFESKQPNLDAYRELLPKVMDVCGMGCWAAYNGYDYTEPEKRFFLGSYYTDYTLCQSYPIQNMKSLRYLGGSEPSNASLSLYEGEFYTGKETLVEGRVLTGITTKVSSFISTGQSEWKLFEGQQLDGNSYCFPAPQLAYYFYNFGGTDSTDWNLTTVGSVFRGCDIKKIEEYKRNNNM